MREQQTGSNTCINSGAEREGEGKRGGETMVRKREGEREQSEKGGRGERRKREEEKVERRGNAEERGESVSVLFD